MVGNTSVKVKWFKNGRQISVSEKAQPKVFDALNNVDSDSFKSTKLRQSSVLTENLAHFIALNGKSSHIEDRSTTTLEVFKKLSGSSELNF